MNKKALEKKKLIKRISIYAFMVTMIAIVTTLVSLFTLGYRFNSVAHQIEKYAMIQFNSTPSGALIYVDGVSLKTRTPDKATLKAGKHTVVMELKGYRVWSKTIDIKAGALEWLNYALLIPEDLSVESVKNYAEVSDSISSPDGRYIIVQPNDTLANLDLIDVSAKDINSKELTIPSSSYSDSLMAETTHKFVIHKWDSGGRYLLVNHIYNEASEWLVVDTQDTNQTKNITKTFDLPISGIEFIGTSGNTFYALSGGDIRKLDLVSGTISRPLVNRVSSFRVYDSKIVSYVGFSEDQLQTVIGLYRDGDDTSYVIKSIDKVDNSMIKAEIANYYNEYYLAISDGKSVEIMNGSFPVSNSQESSMKQYVYFNFDYDIKELSFSPSGQYVVAKSGEYFASYDLEYKKLSSSTISGDSSDFNCGWLNGNYIWSDRDGKLTIREFDGANLHEINNVVQNQAIAITTNDRYIYSFSQTNEGSYQLQRVLIRI